MKAAACLGVAVIVSASLFLAFAGESYFGAKCPTDDAVIAWFHANKKALDDLLNIMAADDEKVTPVGYGTVELRPGTALPESPSRTAERLWSLTSKRVGRSLRNLRINFRL